MPTRLVTLPRRLLTPVPLPSWTAELLLLVPRLVCGYLLTTQFGAPKFGMPWSPADHNLGGLQVAYWFPNDVREFGGIFAMIPGMLAWLAAFAEAVGGVALILGLLVRPAAALIIPTLLVAIFKQQWNNGLWNMLPALGFTWVAVYLLVLGGGRLSLDAMLARWMAADAVALPRRDRMASVAAVALVLVTLARALTGVQPAYDRTIVYEVDVSRVRGVQRVGVRGGDNPLSWDTDRALQPVVRDSLYRGAVTYRTGYLATEVKFTVNGEFELANGDNRRVRVAATTRGGDTTIYRAVFDVR